MLEEPKRLYICSRENIRVASLLCHCLFLQTFLLVPFSLGLCYDSTDKLGYNDIGLRDTLSITLGILWYQLITRC